MTDPLSKTNSLRVDAGEPTSVATAGHHNGLTSDEASLRAKKFGPNAMLDTSEHPLRMALEKFWARVPWMLESIRRDGAWNTLPATRLVPGVKRRSGTICAAMVCADASGGASAGAVISAGVAAGARLSVSETGQL